VVDAPPSSGEKTGAAAIAIMIKRIARANAAPEKHVAGESRATAPNVRRRRRPG